MSGFGIAVRILVVDDHRESARATRLLLELMGHEATLSYDGTSAIDHARTVVPDAVLLDGHMPGIDGYETCRRLRALAPLRTAVIIALTGASDEGVMALAREAGFDLAVSKPFKIEEIQQALELLAGAGPEREAIRRSAS